MNLLSCIVHAMLLLMLFQAQVTFQLILSTDGRVSFAAFIFENPSSLFFFARFSFVKVGFDGGRHTGQSADVGGFLRDNNLDLPPVSVYRIDGKG